MRLRGKSVVITGATGAIGGATAARFLSEGANVVLVGRSSEKLDALAEALQHPKQTITAVADALDEVSVKQSLDSCVDSFGSLDAVFANAGTEGPVKPIDAYSIEEFNHTLMVNVTGVWLYLKHSLPKMKSQGRGSFIAVASGAGVVGFPGLGPYSASKHAVCGLVKTACLENANAGVRINTLAPGPIDNRMMQSLAEQSNPSDPQEFREAVMSSNPMGRYGSNEEIANLALFLASDESSYCNGGVYLADGGLTAG
jgi:NAD(P)-dependent dehydrogenase (short-subunit alcohol dehydrogenase family)